MYIKKIEDFSSKSLLGIFEKHISKNANVVTDEWKGYGPISEANGYRIEQIPGKKGQNFKAPHTMVHQVKSWIRTIHSWVSPKHIERYFNEFCHRTNRSRTKETIFHNLVKRMVAGGKIYRNQIV